MQSTDWLRDLPATRDSVALARIAQLDSHLVHKLRFQSQRRRRQGERIKELLCQSPAAKLVPELLGEMEQELGVQLNVHSLENPGCRLVWKVAFRHKTPWTFSYFLVRRLFAGQELVSEGSHYLGPAWEAPEAWMDYTEDEIAELVSREEVAVRSATEERRIEVADAGWVLELQDALREAYQHPLRQGWS